MAHTELQNCSPYPYAEPSASDSGWTSRTARRPGWTSVMHGVIDDVVWEAASSIFAVINSGHARQDLGWASHAQGSVGHRQSQPELPAGNPHVF